MSSDRHLMEGGEPLMPSGERRHVVGNHCGSIVNGRHAIENRRHAFGSRRHAFGSRRHAFGSRRHAFGSRRHALGNSQHALGKCLHGWGRWRRRAGVGRRGSERRKDERARQCGGPVVLHLQLCTAVLRLGLRRPSRVRLGRRLVRRRPTDGNALGALPFTQRVGVPQRRLEGVVDQPKDGLPLGDGL
jgi:hypothetical protein